MLPEVIKTDSLLPLDWILCPTQWNRSGDLPNLATTLITLPITFCGIILQHSVEQLGRSETC